MIRIKDISKPNSIEEAWELYKVNKKAKLIGGGAFLRLSEDINIVKAIDLYNLNLNNIIETDEAFIAGAMVTLRQMETDEKLKLVFKNFLSDSVKNIVGVQLRNIATIGGTIYPRYGFSDLITALLVLDTRLKFFNSGEIKLEDYLLKGLSEKDILENIIISKKVGKASFQMLRNSESDFAILNCGVGRSDNIFKIAIGARPGRGFLAINAMKFLNESFEINEDVINKAAEMASEELVFGSNRIASSEYRKEMCKVLIKRGLIEVLNVN